MQRTVLVWIIFVLIVLSVIVQFGSLIFVYSGVLPLPPEAMAEIQMAGSDEIAVDLVAGLYFLVAGITLFMMRRIALPLFLAGFPLTLGQYALAAYNRGWDNLTAAGGLYMLAISFAIGILVCLYIWSLDRRGALA